MEHNDFEKIRQLVGNVTEKQLRYVDCYVSQDLGIFIPSVGFCEYAITPMHVHPSYSFTVFFSKEHTYLPIEINIPVNHYAGVAMLPDFPHEEPVHDTFLRYIAIFISIPFYEEQYYLYKEKKPESYQLKQFAMSDEIMGYIKQFMKEYENKQTGQSEILDALAKLITHSLIRGLEKTQDCYYKNEPFKETTIKEITAYIHQNFGDKLKVKELAERINLSESHFLRVFKKETKQSPIAYLIKVRLEKSQKLLRDTNQSITEIALQCGFNSASHFSTVFTKQMKLKPTEYRKLYMQIK